MDKISYKLEIFEGPLDLLLHLVNKNKLDIKNIKISILLDQYVQHINRMEELGVYVESEFLNMVSRLIYIKTVSLLPKSEEEKTLKEELSAELIEHQKLKDMSKVISNNISFNSFVRQPIKISTEYQFNNKININKFINCYINLYKRANLKFSKNNENLNIITSRKIVPVYSRAISILRKLKKLGSFKYSTLFTKAMSKSSLIATFLAVLELVKIKRIKIDSDYNCIRGKDDGM